METLTINTTGFDVGMANDPKSGVTIITLEPHAVAPEPERIPPVPKEVKHAKRHASPRFKRVRKTCPVCERGYLAIPRSLYCSDICRHRAYQAQGGSKKARAWALRIHAGASGVEVQTDDQ